MPALTTSTYARPKLALLIVVTVVMTALVLMHTTGVNGPTYWTWSWRRLSAWMLYPSMLLAATPFALAQWCWSRDRPRRALTLLAISTLLLMLTAMANQPPTWLRRLPLIVQNAAITGYYTDASILHEQPNVRTWEWLFQYPDIVLLLHHHARYKPPGLMLYYLALLATFGKGATAATLGALGIVLAGAAAVPATYVMIKRVSANASAAFCGASYLSLCPSLLLFVPMFDVAYVCFAVAMLVSYYAAVSSPAWKSAAAFGAGMALLLFLSYIFLIYGLFFIVFWMLNLCDHGGRAARRTAFALATAAIVCCGLYFLFWVFTGFDPIRTFFVIEEAQTIALIPLERPFPAHLFWDVVDFAMGAGYIAIVLIGFYYIRKGRSAILGRTPEDRLVQVSMLQVVTVAAAALLPGESARLWMLLLPMLMTPVAFELSTWPMKYRAVVYACLWLIMVAICQNMTFIYMGPELDGPR